MVDVERVCCMCGDVGFPDKIFRCIKCHHRFQHSYCSNYYSSEPAEVCDWCQAEMVRSTTSKPAHAATAAAAAGGSSKKSKAEGRSTEYSGLKIKQHDHHHREEAGGSEKVNKSSSASPKTSTRRYKLLKDVMC